MTEEEKRLKASRENRRDLEAELKEERDRYDAQNQEAYDKEVSGENFLRDRAQEDEEEIDGGKLAQSIAFETSVGLATDLATTKLLALPPLYALANFVSGATANLIAQKIRGETNISIGEILASGGVGIIPGTTIKTGKQLSKVVGKAGTVKRAAIATGLAGVGSEAVRIGIDEKRLLSTQEALVGGTLGGITGASLQKIVNAAPAVLKRFHDSIPEPEVVYAMSPKKTSSPGNILPPDGEGTFRNLPRDTGDNYKEFIDITSAASEFRNLPAEQQERLSKFVRGRLKSTDWEDLGLAAKYEATGEFDQGDWDRYVQAVRKNEDDVYTLITILNKIETDQAIKSGDIKEIGRRMADLFTVGETALDRRRALDAFTESDLQKIIDNEGGFIEFRTDRMARENSLPYIIRDVGDLSAAVRRRLDEIKDNPYFEFGHQKAALNILLDNNAANRANYLNNALPEPTRSIIETRFEGNDLNDLLDNGFEGVVVEPGNRSTQAAADLDPNINKILGTAEDVEESFLNFMRPQFDVANEFPVNLRQNIIDDYTEELGIIAEDLAQYGVDVNNSTFDFSNLNRSKFKEVLNKYRTGNIPLYRILEIEETQRLFREFPELAKEFLTVRPGSSGNYAINYLSNQKLSAEQAALLKSLRKEINKLGTPFTKRPRKPITKRATEGGKYNLDGSKKRTKKFKKKKDDDDDNLAPV